MIVTYLTDVYRWNTARFVDINNETHLVLERKSDGYMKTITLQYINNAIIACDEYMISHGVKAARADEWNDILQLWNSLNS